MPIRKFEIYRVPIKLKNCEDPRPVLVLGNPIPDPSNPGKEMVEVAPISSAWDLFVSAMHYAIDDQDPAFKQTGLSRKSYVIANFPVWVSVTRFPPRAKGILTGDLLQGFISWTPSKPK